MSAAAKHRAIIGPNNAVSVHVSGDVLFSLDKLVAVQKTILGRLGCQACCSGFVINWQLTEGEFGV